MCCVFSPWLDSLSSAATSVGAKPNHGFFGCQHPRRKFFRGVPGHDPGGDGAYVAASASTCTAWRARHARRLRKSAQNKPLFDCASFFVQRASRTRDVASIASEGVREGVCRLSGKDGGAARFRRHARPIAQKCAGSGAPPATAPGPFARLSDTVGDACRRRRSRSTNVPETRDGCVRRRVPATRRHPARPASHAGRRASIRLGLHAARPATAGSGSPSMRLRTGAHAAAAASGQKKTAGARAPAVGIRGMRLRRRRGDQCSSSSSSSA